MIAGDALVESYLAKVRAAELPTSEEAVAFLKWFHARHPGVTARHYARHRAALGMTTYALLATRATRGLDASATLLDLACGDGVSTAELALALPHATIIGLDVSEADLALAKARVPSARFVCAPAQRTGLDDASVDAVICHFALMLMNEAEDVVAELARVMKRGATFTAANLTRLDITAFSPPLAELVDTLRSRDLPAYPRLGIGDPRWSSQEGLVSLFSADAGFDPPVVERVILPTPDDPDAVCDMLRGFYWFDMLTDESRAEFDARAPALAVAATRTDGNVGVSSEFLLATVTRTCHENESGGAA